MTARILTAAVALFAAAAATAAPVPKDVKKSVEHDGDSYRITFPTKPNEVTKSAGTDVQGEFTRAGVGGESADGRLKFAVSVRESETNFDTAFTADEIAAHFRANAARFGTVEDDRVTAVGSDVAARWLVVKADAGDYVRMLVFVRGHRMYAVLVGGADLDAVNSKEADKFFDSLVLTK